ncbi:MAG: hypothetical protein V1661_01465 [bacterium]
MKYLVIILALLFFSFKAEASPRHAPKQIFIAGVANEIILRTNIAELGRAFPPAKKISLSPNELFSIFRNESYEWFWKPKLRLMKRESFELNIAAVSAGPPGLGLKF